MAKSDVTPAVEAPVAEELIPRADQEQVILVSGLDHACELSYAGTAFMLPPRGRTGAMIKAQLGAVPRNVTIVPV